MAKKRAKSKSEAQKPTLAAELRAQLERRGYTLGRAAEMLRVRDQTLRSWFTRNRWPNRDLEVLLSLAGIDPKRLDERYTFTWARGRERDSDEERGLSAAFRRLDVVLEDLNRFYRGMLEETRMLFVSMGEKDFFAFASLDITPLEFEPLDWERLGRPVGDAIQRGAILAYFHPSDQVIVAMQGKWGWRRLPRRIDFDQEFDAFRKKVEAYLTHKGEDEKLARERVKRQLRQYFCDDVAPFFIPGWTFGMYRGQDDNLVAESRMTIRMPIGAVRASEILLLPCDRIFTQRFEGFVLEELKSKRDKDDDDSARWILDKVWGQNGELAYERNRD